VSDRDPARRPVPRNLLGTRREILIGGAFLAAAATALAFKPRHHDLRLGSSRLEDLVPKVFAGWNFEATSGLVLPPQDQLRDKIYSQLLTRVYSRADGAGVMLLIAYSGSQDGAIQVHRPEVCYPASGYDLTRVDQHSVSLTGVLRVPGRFIVAETGLRREQLIYWTRLGNRFPTRWSEQRLAVFEENLDGVIPDGVLVRISTLVQDDAQQLLDGFAEDLYRSVGTRMKNVLAGVA
jgi:EpsI family protein